MKFTDGYWRTRAGVTAYFPAQVYDVEVEPGAMTVYGPTKKSSQRGDTLNQPVLTVRFSSPAASVIRVQVCHHKGGRRRLPEFELQEQPLPEVVISNAEQSAVLTSGQLSVRVE